MWIQCEKEKGYKNTETLNEKIMGSLAGLKLAESEGSTGGDGFDVDLWTSTATRVFKWRLVYGPA